MEFCTEEQELFVHPPSFLPNLTEGETLFSWSARYHRLSGNVIGSQSSLQLYGSRRAGLRADFPYNLGYLSRKSGGLLGDVETLARERTLFGFYAPFLDKDTFSNVLDQMRGNCATKLKSLLGLMPSRIGGSHPLKACSRCMVEDRRDYGVTRWHLEHQWPSVWICRRHLAPMMRIQPCLQPKDLRCWLLPEDLAQKDWLVEERLWREAKERLLSIVNASRGFVSNATHDYDVRLLRHTYLLAAKSHGWLAPDGSVRLEKLRQAFLQHFSGLQGTPLFPLIQSATAEHGGLLGVLMRNYPGRRHPAKHAVLVAFLFDSFEKFIEAHLDVIRISMEVGVENLHEQFKTIRCAEIRRIVEVEKRSVSSAARELDIPASMAVKFASKNGIVYARRPRVLRGDLEAKLRALLEQGFPYLDISKQIGVKKSFVRSYLAKDNILRQRWYESRFGRQMESHRDALTNLLNSNPGVPLKKLRQIPGNGVSWLVRNDREWLVQHLPMLKKAGG